MIQCNVLFWSSVAALKSLFFCYNKTLNPEANSKISLLEFISNTVWAKDQSSVLSLPCVAITDLTFLALLST